MAFKDIFKVSRKTFFSPKAWFDYDRVKSETIYFWQSAKTVVRPLFRPQRTIHAETFQQAVARFKLTEADIKEAAQFYFACAVLFCLLSVLATGLFILFIMEGHFSASLIVFSIVLFLCSQAFKYHFWYFQIIQRKLGCTFSDWWVGKPRGKSHD